MYIMKNTKDYTHRLNLTHIATDYPDSVLITKNDFNDVVNNITTPEKLLDKILGDDWDLDFFYDNMTTI